MKTITALAFLRLTLLCAAVALCVLPFRTAQAAQFIPLGEDASANGVSGDGSFVVGTGYGYFSDALRWTSSGQVLNLGDLPGACCSGAEAASLTGSVVVGGSSVLIDGYGSPEAFRWTEGGGMQGLGTLPGDYNSGAVDVSADGSIVIGLTNDKTPHAREAFRWIEGIGMVGLGTLPGDTESWAGGVSADGSVVVGVSQIWESDIAWTDPEAFLWTESAGMQGLGALPGDTISEASGISADGSTVVGNSFNSGVSPWPSTAFRWTAGTGMLGLGYLPGHFWSWATGVSGDGSVVVGHSAPSWGRTDQASFIWDETHGMRRLQDVLTAEGLDLTGWRLDLAHGVSDDGNVIVGYGYNPAGYREGWIARLNVVPEPTTFALLVAGFLCVSLRHRQSGRSVMR